MTELVTSVLYAPKVPTSERRDLLLRLLRQRSDWLVADLARDVGASRRTVLRDLNHLRLRGFDIVGLAGPGGGVRLEATSVMITSQLDADEVVALTLAVAVAAAMSNTPFAGAADRALGKIEASLPIKRAEELRRFRERVLVSQSAPNMQPKAMEIDDTLVGVFESAFTARKCLSFDYTDRHGEPSQRTVEPQGLLVLPPLWYVISWDPARDAFRSFRADRIARPRLTEDTFAPRTLDHDWGFHPHQLGAPPGGPEPTPLPTR